MLKLIWHWLFPPKGVRDDKVKAVEKLINKAVDEGKADLKALLVAGFRASTWHAPKCEEVDRYIGVVRVSPEDYWRWRADAAQAKLELAAMALVGAVLEALG